MATLDQLDAGDKSGSDRAKPDHEHAQPSLCRGDRVGSRSHEIPGLERNALFPRERHQRWLPLGWNPACGDPVLDGALAAAQELSECTLSTKPPNHTLGRIGGV